MKLEFGCEQRRTRTHATKEVEPPLLRRFWIVAMTETYRSVLNETVSNCIASMGGANHPTASLQDRFAALLASAPWNLQRLGTFSALEPSALCSMGLARIGPALAHKRISRGAAGKSATRSATRERDGVELFGVSL